MTPFTLAFLSASTTLCFMFFFYLWHMHLKQYRAAMKELETIKSFPPSERSRELAQALEVVQNELRATMRQLTAEKQLTAKLQRVITNPDNWRLIRSEQVSANPNNYTPEKARRDAEEGARLIIPSNWMPAAEEDKES